MENPGTNTTIGRNHQRKGEFRKVGENLYRYSTSGTYYAVFRVQGNGQFSLAARTIGVLKRVSERPIQIQQAFAQLEHDAKLAGNFVADIA